MKENYILAIETSCDDTSVSILKNHNVISCVTKNSINDLIEYGGIVPEIASRKHAEYIISVFDEALAIANINATDINYVCYTNEPGLAGSLHVGEIFAKTIGDLINVKVYPINHIHAHIFSPFINHQDVEYPFLSLIASGKTTSIYLVNNPYDIKEIVKTNDDAIGEAFDKIGKYLGYDYPAGPIIDSKYNESKATITFAKQKPMDNFSFSGVKSNILRKIEQSKKNNEVIDDIQISSSFMKWSIDTLINKLNYFKEFYKVNIVAIGGGVSSNSLFAKKINEIFDKKYIPLKEYCCDNAAMIGYLFFQKYVK